MKNYVSAIFTMAILSLALVSCEPSNKPTKDPVPEQLTSINDMYDSFKSCLSLNYAEGMTVTFKREDRSTEDFTVNESFNEYDSEEGESAGYAALSIVSNNWEIDIELYAEEGYGETYEGAYISIAGTSTNKADYECECKCTAFYPFLRDPENGNFWTLTPIRQIACITRAFVYDGNAMVIR